MKKVILFIFLLLILTACKGYEVTEIAKSTEQIQEEAKQILLSGEYNHEH